MPDELEPGVFQQVLDVALGAGEQIVGADHLVATLQQPVDEVGAQEACAACDEDSLAGVVLTHLEFLLVAAEKVPRVDLVRHIEQFVGKAVGHDDVRLPLECGKIVDDRGTVEVRLFQDRLVDDDFHAFGLQPLHDALHAAVAVVVAAGLHHQPVYAHRIRLADAKCPAR